MDIGVEEIRGWHQTRGFTDVGYHFVIRRNGEIEKGREVSAIGAHVKGHNANSIGICMVGGINAAGKSDANFTLAQYNTLSTLITSLKHDYGNNLEVNGHRDYANKACPSFDIHSLLEHI